MRVSNAYRLLEGGQVVCGEVVRPGSHHSRPGTGGNPEDEFCDDGCSVLLLLTLNVEDTPVRDLLKFKERFLFKKKIRVSFSRSQDGLLRYSLFLESFL